MSIIESFTRTIQFFNTIKEEGLIDDYALIGGLALSAWIRPRTTRDIDIVVAVSDRVTWPGIISIVEGRLQKKVAPFRGTQRTNIKEKLSFFFGHVEVDVISTKDFDLAARAIENAIPAEVFGMPVKVVTPEYLVLLKLLPLSDQDAVDIRALMKKADVKKIREIADEYFLLPKLEPFLPKSKSKRSEKGN